MKINPTAAYYAYNKISEHLRPVHAEEAAGALVRSGNTDQIQISPEAAAQSGSGAVCPHCYS